MATGLRGGLGLPRSEGTRGRRSAVASAEPDKKSKKKLDPASVWREARGLIWAHHRRIALGLAPMLVNRLAGLVLPASSKYLIDDIAGKGRAELLMPLALAAGAATLVQAVTSFALSQVLGVAAQRAITDMRRQVEEHVARLPVRYFDSTQAGQLLSRIMNDAEGIRNLVGSGLVQLTGSVVTAIAALAYLFYLNWRLTLATIVALAVFGGGMAWPSSACGRCSASAARSPRRCPAASTRPSAASASSRPTPPRSAKSWCSPRAFIGCSATSRGRSPACPPSPRSPRW